MPIDYGSYNFGGPSGGYTETTVPPLGFEDLALIGSNTMSGGLPSGMTWEEYQNSPLSIQNADPSRLRTIEGKSVTEFGSMAEYERALTDFMAKPAVQPPADLQQTDPNLFKILTDEYNDKTNPLIGTNAYEDAGPIEGLRYSQYDSPEEYQTDLNIYNTSRQAAKDESGPQDIWERVRVPLIAGAALFGGVALSGALAGGGAAAGGAGAGGSAAAATGTGAAVGTGTGAAAVGAGTAVGTGGAAVGGGTAAGATAAGSTSWLPTIFGTAVGVGSSIYNSSQAADAAEDAANTVAGAQREATAANLEAQQSQLNYLKEVDALPRQFREQALTQLGEVYLGPEGFQYPEGQLLDQAKNSEMFAMLRDQGADAITRGASATGGLRSGNANEALADNSQRALMSSYAEQQKQYEMGLQGVASLANLPLQTSNISNVMGNIGQTQAAGLLGVGTAQAQGDLAASQAQQQGITNASSILGSGISAFAQNYNQTPQPVTPNYVAAPGQPGYQPPVNP